MLKLEVIRGWERKVWRRRRCYCYIEHSSPMLPVLPQSLLAACDGIRNVYKILLRCLFFFLSFFK